MNEALPLRVDRRYHRNGTLSKTAMTTSRRSRASAFIARCDVSSA
jgi:hypothetical protein